MRNVLVILLLMIGAQAQALSTFELEGVARDNDGKAINGIFDITLRVTSASDANCTLYKETHTGVQSDVLGFFTVDAGSQTHTGFPVIDEVISNSFRQTCFNSSGVQTSQFVPAPTDKREVYISVTYQSASYAIGSMTISPVPVAAEAARVGMHTASSLMRVVDGSNNPVAKSALTSTQFDNLVPLYSTTATDSNHIFAVKANGVPKAKALAYSGSVTITQDDDTITINGAVGGTGTVTNVTAAGAPLSVTDGSTTPTISIAQANTTTAGYLSSADWNTFNNKQPAGNFLTALTGEVTASGPGSATATIAANAVTTAKIADANVTTAKINDKAVTLAKFQDIATNSLLGRSTAATGVPEVITVGSGLSLSGGTLTATNTNAGTVTSVGLTVPTFMTAGADITSSGDIALSFNSQAQNSVFAGPATGGAGAVSFRALDAADVPALNTSKLTNGTLPLARGGTGVSPTGVVGDANKVFGLDAAGTAGEMKSIVQGSGVSVTHAAGTITIAATGSGGTVTSVGVGALPLTITTSSPNPVISINEANTTTAGYLSSSDWNKFNDKIGSTSTFTGDVSGTPGATVVDKIKGKTITAAPTLDGQVLRYNGTSFAPNFIGMRDLRSNVTGSTALATACDASKTLTYDSVMDNLTCSNIAITSAQVTGLGLLADNASVDLSGAEATGILAAGRFPALTGAVTTVAGALATTLGNNVVGSSNITDNSIASADFRQGVARSVVGVTGNAAANVADIQGSANQVLRVDGAGTGLGFGAINLASPAAVTGLLPVANIAATGASGTTFLRGDGTWSTPASTADNLGNHTATTNLNLATFKLVGNGGTTGISIDSSGNIGIGTTGPARPLHVEGPMRLTPQVGAPALPAKGDIYVDDTTGALKWHNGSSFQTVSTAGGDFLASGSVPMTGQIKAANGLVGTPGYTYNSDQDTGFFQDGDGRIGISSNGVLQMTVRPSGISVGTTAVNARLNVKSTGVSTDIVHVANSTGNGSFRVLEDASNESAISLKNISSTETVRIQAAGASTFGGGPIIGRPAQADNDANLDFSAGNLISSTQLCSSSAPDFNIINVKEGAVYTLILDNAAQTAETCSFTIYPGTVGGGGAYTVYYPPGHGPVVAAKPTLYSFMVVGTKVFVSWVPGYGTTP